VHGWLHSTVCVCDVCIARSHPWQVQSPSRNRLETLFSSGATAALGVRHLKHSSLLANTKAEQAEHVQSPSRLVISAVDVALEGGSEAFAPLGAAAPFAVRPFGV